MQPIEIIVIIACVLIVGLVTVTSIINKKKGKTSCGCDCAHCAKGYCHCSQKESAKNEDKEEKNEQTNS